jgi:hypothetical protein
MLNTCQEEIVNAESEGDPYASGVAEIHEIRRRRLKDVLASDFEGRQVDLAKTLARAPSYVSQCITGLSQIGERFARHVELKLGKPKGWLDAYEGTMPFLTPAAIEFALRYESLTQEQRTALESLMSAFGHANKEQPASPPPPVPNH